MVTVALLCPIAEVVDPLVFKHALALVSYASQNGVRVEQVGVTKRTLIHTARNVLAKEFLKTGCEWAFWMDADMLLPSNTLPRLLQTAKEKNAKFVTGVYYQRLGEHLPVLWRKNAETMDGTPVLVDPAVQMDGKEAYRHHYILPHKDAQEAFRADAAGFGCMLTHRSMFETIPFPYFKMISDDCSEDFYFCIEAKKAGFELWANPSLTLAHMSDPIFVTKYQCQIPQEKLREIKV